MNYGYNYWFKPRAATTASFLPTDLPNLSLWLDATDETTINSKLDVDLNGSTDALNLDALITPLGGTTTGTWEFEFTPDVVGFAYLLQSADTDGSNLLGCYMNGTGKLVVISGGGGQFTWVSTSNIFSVGVSSKITIIQDGVELKAYQNDVLISGTFSVSVDKGSWFNYVSSSLDNLRLGCRNYNSGGDTSFVNGKFSSLYIWDDATKTNLVASYLFNNSSDIGKDYTNSYDATNIGTPTSLLGINQEVSQNGDNVYTWMDKSGNGYDFIQATAIQQPIWNNSGFGTNSKANITFDGSDDLLANTTFPLSVPMTWVACYKLPSGNYHLMGEDSGGNFHLRAYPEFRLSNPTTLTDLVTRPNDTPSVVRGLFNGVNSEIQSNESTATSGDTGATTIGTGLSIGLTASWGNAFAGDMVEIVVTTDAMTSDNYASLYAYFNNKYGL
jgi:hypothetical protein